MTNREKSKLGQETWNMKDKTKARRWKRRKSKETEERRIKKKVRGQKQGYVDDDYVYDYNDDCDDSDDYNYDDDAKEEAEAPFSCIQWADTGADASRNRRNGDDGCFLMGTNHLFPFLPPLLFYENGRALIIQKAGFRSDR